MVRRVGFGDTGKRPADGRSGAARPREETPGASHRESPAPDAGRRPIGGRVILRILMLLPLVFVAFGGWMLIDALQFKGMALPARGVVVSVLVDSDSDGTAYTPLIRYMDFSGDIYEAPTHISSSGYDYRVGERVEILYDPTDPWEVRIDDPLSLWAMPVGFTALGSVLFVVFHFVFGRAFGDSRPAGGRP